MVQEPKRFLVRLFDAEDHPTLFVLVSTPEAGLNYLRQIDWPDYAVRGTVEQGPEIIHEVRKDNG